MRARAVAVRAALLVLAAAAAAWAAQHYEMVYVGGGSMEPALASGDLVIIRRGAEAVRTGDIVLVARPGWPRGVLHRVDTAMSDGTFRLRGDANPVADRDLAPAWRIRGRVCLVVPTGRALSAVERLVRRWYNPASQPKSEAMTERREREHAPPIQRGTPTGCKGPTAESATAVHSISRLPETMHGRRVPGSRIIRVGEAGPHRYGGAG